MKPRTILTLAIVALLTLISATLHRTPAQLKVISYNIRLSTGKDGDNSWQHRKNATLTMIRSEQPTIIGCQEMLPEQFHFILDSLPEYEAIGVGRNDGKEAGERMAIFYDTREVELLRWDTFWLSTTPDEPSVGWDARYPRTCTWAWMRHKDSGQTFGVMNTHLDHIGTVAQHQGLALVAQQALKLFPHSMPLFLTGDMNITPESGAFEALRGHFEDSRDVAPESDPSNTFNGWGRREGSLIDYIFIRNATPLRYRVLNADYGAPYISDHYPVELSAEL
jgi:endonuclease/exonuclease/phosphatase family metal-dependent hydrolase